MKPSAETVADGMSDVHLFYRLFRVMRRKATKSLGLLRLLPRLLCFFSQDLGRYLERQTPTYMRHGIGQQIHSATVYQACHLPMRRLTGTYVPDVLLGPLDP